MICLITDNIRFYTVHFSIQKTHRKSAKKDLKDYKNIDKDQRPLNDLPLSPMTDSKLHSKQILGII